MTTAFKHMISIAVLLILLGFTYTSHFCKAEESNPTLTQAKAAIKAAFNEVLAAEKAGANVTDMLKELNQAVNLLPQVEDGNESLPQAAFDGNQSKIQVIYEHAQHVKTVAVNAQLEESIADRNYLLIIATLSLISAFVFLLILSATRSRLKQGYNSKIR